MATLNALITDRHLLGHGSTDFKKPSLCFQSLTTVASCRSHKQQLGASRYIDVNSVVPMWPYIYNVFLSWSLTERGVNRFCLFVY